VSSDNTPAFPAETRKPFCHKGLCAIEWYRPVPMILCPFRLGCVWSPVQIRPPRPTENQMNFGLSWKRRSGAIRAMLRVFYKRSRINPKARGERLDLPHVETAAAGKHFGDDALATDLGQILLSETVLLHQEAKHLDA